MKNKKTHVECKKHNKGFVIPFAVLISSIVLTISFSILTISLKSITLASVGRESRFSFYAADAGAECALFWDVKHPGFSHSIFPTSTGSFFYTNITNYQSPIYCNQNNDLTPQDIKNNSRGSYSVSYGTPTTTTTFSINTRSVSGNSCAKVFVYKDPLHVKIESFGYNICNETDPKRIERAIRITY